jgi:light-harvesting complex 1 beta chain
MHLTGSYGAAAPNDAWSWRLTFLGAFIVLLPLALVAQLLFLPWRSWLPGAEGRQSLVGDVRTSIHSFMSYLT